MHRSHICLDGCEGVWLEDGTVNWIFGDSAIQDGCCAQRRGLILACDMISTRRWPLRHRVHRLRKTARPARPSVTSVANRKRRRSIAVSAKVTTFLAEAADRYPSSDRAFISQEFERYLRCGILRYGFARFRCPSCREEILAAFACNNRGVCPSCCARRSANSTIWSSTHLGNSAESEAVAAINGELVALATEEHHSLLPSIALRINHLTGHLATVCPLAS